MSRKITFKVQGPELELVLAFDHYCRTELQVTAPLNELLKRLLIKILMDAAERSKQQDAEAVAPTPDPAPAVGEQDAD